MRADVSAVLLLRGLCRRRSSTDDEPNRLAPSPRLGFSYDITIDRLRLAQIIQNSDILPACCFVTAPS